MVSALQEDGAGHLFGKQLVAMSAAHEGDAQVGHLPGQRRQFIAAYVPGDDDQVGAGSPDLGHDCAQRLLVIDELKGGNVGRKRRHRRAGGGQPDDAHRHLISFDNREWCNIKAGREFHPCHRTHIGAEERKVRLQGAGPQDVQSKIEFVIADGGGSVPHLIHDFDHALALEPGRDRRPGPHIAAADD